MDIPNDCTRFPIRYSRYLGKTKVLYMHARGASRQSSIRLPQILLGFGGFKGFWASSPTRTHIRSSVLGLIAPSIWASPPFLFLHSNLFVLYINFTSYSFPEIIWINNNNIIKLLFSQYLFIDMNHKRFLLSTIFISSLILYILLYHD